MKKLISYCTCLAIMILMAGCTPGVKSTSTQSIPDTRAHFSEFHPLPSPSPYVSTNKTNSPNVQQQPDKLFGDPHYINTQFGWQQTESGRCLVTKDHGKHWRDATPKLNNKVKEAWWMPYFLDSRHGWMILYQYNEYQITTYNTEDGGVHWTKRGKAKIHYGDGGIFIQFTDASHGFIETLSAGNCTLSGELLVTKDKGENWTNNGDLPFGGQVLFTTPKIGWLTGGPRGGCNDAKDVTQIWFYKSKDGGISWTPVKLIKPSNVVSSKRISSVTPHFFNSRQGVMRVNFEEINISYIYGTNDGGVVWRTIGHVKGYDPQFSDLLHGSVTENGVVKWKTRDGGRTWGKG